MTIAQIDHIASQACMSGQCMYRIAQVSSHNSCDQISTMSHDHGQPMFLVKYF